MQYNCWLKLDIEVGTFTFYLMVKRSVVNWLNTQKHVGVVRTKAPGKSLTFQKITCSKTWKSLTSYRNCNLTLLQTSHVPLWPFFYSHKRKIGSCYQEKTDLLVLLFSYKTCKKGLFDLTYQYLFRALAEVHALIVGINLTNLV